VVILRHQSGSTLKLNRVISMMLDSKPGLRYQISFYTLLLVLFASAFVMKNLDPSLLSNDESLGRLEDKLVIIPNFSEILDVELKKQTFFDFLQPFIDQENRNILVLRLRIQTLMDKMLGGQTLTKKEQAFINTLSEEYEVVTLEDFSEAHFRLLLRRVDVIPSSLALAQAANESAWGTSRFALEGNNFFGQWCYSEGCGLVPRRRHQDASHEVRSFDSIQASVHAYFMNINTFPSYQNLRRMRMQLREQNKAINGYNLSEGLHSYSERGEDYVDELQSIILSNGLLERDNWDEA
ncbi:MAG: glucosaminidase domain-containing protein, partial [Pseudomonadales bacterium]|nr:glucosaminidase domain-containing protein [Pseudomonadales bacterium]